MRRALALIGLLGALTAAGCGSNAPLEGGGTITGQTLTVYSSLPSPGAGSSRDMVEGEKLALLQSGGRIGANGVNFVSVDEAAPDPAQIDERAAHTSDVTIRDPQVIAVIGVLDSRAAMTALPLLNAAGVLLASPGATYPGFTGPLGPGEPTRWYPSGHRTFARLVQDDGAQARAIVAAAARAAGARAPRLAIEQEPGHVADVLAAAVRRAAAAAGARVVGDAAHADAVVYAGADPQNAAGVADGVARETPGAAIVLPDALTRAGIADRLSPAARRRAVLVTSAPEPGSTPELRAFATAFRERMGREPGPYAAVGYDAMRAVLGAIRRAGADANRRQAVIDAFLTAAPAPRPYAAWRPRAGGAAYLDLG
jgi:branched-chain amino acid transport system substrate-binding protein